MADETIAIIGAGIVGLAIGREITLRRPGARVVLLEKEAEVAQHQTGHNSGVVHAGIYYTPGSLKAELCTRGRLLLREYCAERGIAYDECGKLVVAVRADELGRLDNLEKRARENGVPGLRRVDPAGIREIEPHAAGLAALHSPETAITDFPGVARAFAADIGAAGGEVRTGFAVDRLTPQGARIEIAAGERRLLADRVIVCAGIQSDRVAKLAGDAPGPRIIPFRGEYMRVKPAKADLVRGMIYPVPDPRYPFLGVHFTRRVTGVVEVGPNAVLATAKEGYRRTQVNVFDLAGIAAWPGTWRMARQHWRTGVKEVLGSLSQRRYMAEAMRYVPEIGAADVERAGAGVRAQALDRDGSLVDDFRIHRLGPVTAVRNAPSPAATSSLAIAEHVVGQIFE
ncbi:putative FAD-dependent oxidoreductase [Actinoplanes missouriensis 431]|uniref:Putative FAD-dependent oxidoreductase n=1 Tax=Actinoplanes missouriensis (strain ATCC 14538 / DSM 43046 / CBS 188.64 / JCM 3121 / NBRC 102363 / NCIMB 12654 / NRRL B-3342 / UNCC 431) TaxID=512565 RepID=I0HBX9_ACTM4|nr:L-2-hydroxyglutarate oxidase [Actinoplanes missouriensis]BAL90516.1 putative FAD-dependent oxidoreductase [Actinoplanes missouriensis 431]